LPFGLWAKSLVRKRWLGCISSREPKSFNPRRSASEGWGPSIAPRGRKPQRHFSDVERCST
jgi:hypothetical protein